MNRLNPNKVGIGTGAFYALCHTVWSVMVAAGVAKPALDWILSLHFLNIPYTMNPFQITTAVMLVLTTLIFGYVVGWVFARVWNLLHTSG
jgi:hypothetical protein